jgi:hypothetical protein
VSQLWESNPLVPDYETGKLPDANNWQSLTWELHPLFRPYKSRNLLHDNLRHEPLVGAAPTIFNLTEIVIYYTIIKGKWSLWESNPLLPICKIGVQPLQPKPRSINFLFLFMVESAGFKPAVFTMPM